MRRILYYDIHMKIGSGSELEVIGAGSLDEAKKLLEQEKFDLIGINAGIKGAFEFAQYIGSNTTYGVVVLVRPPIRLTFDPTYREEISVKNAILMTRLLACKDRHVKTQKNLGTLIQILNEQLVEKYATLK